MRVIGQRLVALWRKDTVILSGVTKSGFRLRRHELRRKTRLWDVQKWVQGNPGTGTIVRKCREVGKRMYIEKSD